MSVEINGREVTARPQRFLVAVGCTVVGVVIVAATVVMLTMPIWLVALLLWGVR
jgi:hypothetical protein